MPGTGAEKQQATNEQLRTESGLERKKISEVATSIRQYCENTTDPMLPSIWGRVDDANNPYRNKGGKCIIL
eukprot:m.334845 g.334845  ORF g.334845 m.334845 type:complete len:71 (+) comp17450_c0_seq1:125-337(+)